MCFSMGAPIVVIGVMKIRWAPSHPVVAFFEAGQGASN
ncbi:hypothetical protein CSB93_4431 [Pseudomonas paraeruginosa]|uniref:Uncharacterized protein n=1 Tax=Pseudomonas paraeruginosa TaxID=2994495 RepID=A0A2R3IRS0_9PSED|nr:hypothetical protein CSB93_4431 [Pseudomonas paraeruginosa]AWE95298.1 hypothetical protein CSC28_3221 [Pseudomonas paraeruginosa]PTC36560.1 hypothetical protein CLJ1_3053 [Pseudomonas aeruginosa]